MEPDRADGEDGTNAGLAALAVTLATLIFVVWMIAAGSGENRPLIREALSDRPAAICTAMTRNQAEREIRPALVARRAGNDGCP